MAKKSSAILSIVKAVASIGDRGHPNRHDLQPETQDQAATFGDFTQLDSEQWPPKQRLIGPRAIKNQVKEHSDWDAEKTSTQQPSANCRGHDHGQNDNWRQQRMKNGTKSEWRSHDVKQRKQSARSHRPVVNHRALENFSDKHSRYYSEPEEHLLPNKHAAALFAGDNSVFSRLHQLIERNCRELDVATITTAVRESSHGDTVILRPEFLVLLQQ